MNAQSIEMALRRIYPDVKGKHPEFKVCCPKCDDTRYRLGINAKLKLGHCFNCDWKFGEKQLLQLIGKVSIYEENSFAELEKDFQVIDEVTVNKPQSVTKAELKITAKSFSELARCDCTDSYFLAAVTYLENRGISLDSAIAHNFMLGDKRSRLSGRIVIPIIENGEVISYQARSIENRVPKYLNPPKGLGGSSKSSLVYNIDITKEFDSVYICEGVFSAMSVGVNALAIFGKELSDVQASKIINSGVRVAYIVFDSGAKSSAHKAAKKLWPRVEVYIANLEGGDPNELEPSALREFLDTAEEYDEFTDLLQ